MKKLLTFVMLFGVVCLAWGCSDHSSNPASSNSTTNSGVNTLLRKEIGFALQQPNADYRFGTAYATRSSVNSQYSYGIIPVTNQSSSTRCFIELDGITYHDQNGNILDVCTDSLCLDFDFVEGVVQQSQRSDLLTNTCLKPSQTGYVLFIENTAEDNFYDQVASMHVTRVSGRVGFTEPEGKLEEQSGIYSSTSVTVTAKNVGRKTVEEFLSAFILEHSDGSPVFWGFFGPASPEIVAPGATTTLTGLPFYDGSASQGISLLDWDYPSNRAKQMYPQAVYGASSDETMRVLHKMRTEAEAQKQSIE